MKGKTKTQTERIMNRSIPHRLLAMYQMVRPLDINIFLSMKYTHISILTHNNCLIVESVVQESNESLNLKPSAIELDASKQNSKLDCNGNSIDSTIFSLKKTTNDNNSTNIPSQLKPASTKPSNLGNQHHNINNVKAASNINKLTNISPKDTLSNVNNRVATPNSLLESTSIEVINNILPYTPSKRVKDPSYTVKVDGDETPPLKRMKHQTSMSYVDQDSVQEINQVSPFSPAHNLKTDLKQAVSGNYVIEGSVKEVNTSNPFTSTHQGKNVKACRFNMNDGSGNHNAMSVKAHPDVLNTHKSIEEDTTAVSHKKDDVSSKTNVKPASYSSSSLNIANIRNKKLTASTKATSTSSSSSSLQDERRDSDYNESSDSQGETCVSKLKMYIIRMSKLINKYFYLQQYNYIYFSVCLHYHERLYEYI